MQPTDITAIGVGGPGLGLLGLLARHAAHPITTVAMDTDQISLDRCEAMHKLLLGPKTAGGLGAVGNPETGRQAAWESRADIQPVLEARKQLLIFAGLGGGTGAGAAPVIAQIAREMEACALGFVTTPFVLEGNQPKDIFGMGVDAFCGACDATILISGQKILNLCHQKDAAAGILKEMNLAHFPYVKAVTDIFQSPGPVKIGFHDLYFWLKNEGIAQLAFGEARGGERAKNAAREAVSGGYMGELPLKTAKKVFYFFSGGNMTATEIVEAEGVLLQGIGDKPEILWGVDNDDALADVFQVTLIATRFK